MSDTDFPFDPDDPRVTAYALDEMHDAGARAGFEQILARSPEARAMVEEIRALSGQLIAEYDEERRLAQGAPSNVITLALAAPRQAAWVGQLLRMAAALAVLGIAGAMLAPYFRGPQAVKLHPEGERALAVMGDARIKDAVVAAPNLKSPALSPQTMDGLRAPAAVARGGVATQMAIPVLGDMNAPASSFAMSSVNGKVDQTAAAQPAEPGADAAKTRIIGRTGESSFAKDVSAVNAAAAATPASEEFDAKLKPALTLKKSVGALGAVAQAQPAPATVAGNALGGGGASAVALPASVASAKDAFFQNRYLSGGHADGNGDQLNLSDSKRLAPASQTRAAETPAIPDDAGFVSSADAPLSTFAIALNNPSRQQSLAGETKELRRMREAAGGMLSEFPFADAPPPPGDPHALAVHMESASCPWAPAHRLVRIGIKGRDLGANSEKDEADDQSLSGAGNVRQVQVKFNPAAVAAYRLLGGAQREIKLNAWQEASVLYEVVLAKAGQDEANVAALERLPVDRPPIAQTPTVGQMARLRSLSEAGLVTVAVQPAALDKRLSDAPIDEFSASSDLAAPEDVSGASADLKFAAAVAAYDLASKAPQNKGAPSLDLAAELAKEGLGDDPGGYRAEFLKTVRKAQAGR